MNAKQNIKVKQRMIDGKSPFRKNVYILISLEKLRRSKSPKAHTMWGTPQHSSSILNTRGNNRFELFKNQAVFHLFLFAYLYRFCASNILITFKIAKPCIGAKKLQFYKLMILTRSIQNVIFREKRTTQSLAKSGVLSVICDSSKVI